MNKEDNKLFELKKAFISGRHLSNKDICELLDIKRSRVYDYINMLKSEGISLSTEQAGHSIYYFVSEQLSEEALYEPLTNRDILRFKILTLLSSKGPLTSKDICRYLYADETDSPEDTYNRIPRTSTYYKEIEAMIAEEMLIIYKQHKSENETDHGNWHYKRVLIPTGKGYPSLLSLDLEGQNLMNATVASGHAQGKALRSLHKKIALITGDNADYDFDESLFLQYGCKYQMDNRISEYFQTLLENRFRENVLTFNYRGIPRRFETGMVVYSQDKDMLYLIGHMAGTRKNSKGRINTIILKFSDITDISHTSDKNNEYDNPYYHKYLQDMFSISDEKPKEVEIHFQNTSTIRFKLERLCKLRINAKINIKTNTIIYTDIVSGMSDFARYLRSFGYKYTIKKPDALKQSLETTIERSLKRYSNE